MIEPEMAFCDLNGYMDTAEAHDQVCDPLRSGQLPR